MRSVAARGDERPLRAPALAPFRVRSFRFQWPADVATSWAFEMENIILAWYILVETGSVLMLTFFATLQFIGTLLAPMFGVLGDRFGHRNVLSAMRGVYAVLATTLMTCAFLGLVSPVLVLVVATMNGLVRASDIGMRSALIGATIPGEQLMGAMGIQRVSQDTARIAGALTGAGIVAALGFAKAYLFVAAFYMLGVALTLQCARRRENTIADAPQAESMWRELKEGIKYVWNDPTALPVMLFAFLLNATAFPMFMSLLSVVAKEVYHADQTTLGYMTAAGATGALLASVTMTRFGNVVPPARLMMLAGAGWLASVLVFSQMDRPALGIPMLTVCGYLQSLCLVAMSAILLRTSEPRLRGRVMGIRMLAIYGNLPGLLLSGPLIAAYGYPATATSYCIFGLVATAVIVLRWHAQLWERGAESNAR
jgi:MFS family permease